MRNAILFIVLAILTVAALVAYNAVKTTQRVAQEASPSAALQPTGETGGALRSFLGLGNQPTSTPIPSTGFIPNATRMPTVTLGPTGIEMTKGGIPLPTNRATPTPKTVTQSSTSTSQHSISLTENGFSPPTLTVKAGTMVMFHNDSAHLMQIVSDNTSGLSMSSGLSKGSSYQFQFNSVGTFTYRNQQKTNETGTIIVQ